MKWGAMRIVRGKVFRERGNQRDSPEAGAILAMQKHSKETSMAR